MSTSYNPTSNNLNYPFKVLLNQRKVLGTATTCVWMDVKSRENTRGSVRPVLTKVKKTQPNVFFIPLPPLTWQLVLWMVVVLADSVSSPPLVCIFLSALWHGSSSNCEGSVQPGRRKQSALLTKSLADWSSGREAVTVAIKIAWLGKRWIVESPGTQWRGEYLSGSERTGS